MIKQVSPALRLLFLDAWSIFNCWRILGYEAKDIFHGAHDGHFFMELRQPDLPIPFKADMGQFPDEYSDDDCLQLWLEFIKEPQSKLGLVAPDGSWPEGEAHFKNWRAKHSVELLVRMIMSGYKPKVSP